VKLRGIPLRNLENLARTVQLHQGTLELIKILKSVGFKVALLSSGLDLFLRNILQSVKLDYAFSNTLRVDEGGILTGELEEPVLTHGTKNEILEFIMNAEDVHRDQVIAIGDGSARSQFIRNVGLSIAFNPVDSSIQTDGILSHAQITSLLYCLGIPKSELEKMSGGIV
jgi:phosphoserine phosphatase